MTKTPNCPDLMCGSCPACMSLAGYCAEPECEMTDAALEDRAARHIDAEAHP